LFALITGFPDETDRIYCFTHHLNTDGVSWRIVTEDLKTIYNYLSEHGKDIPVEKILGPKGTSYRQWLEALAAHKTQAEEERRFWKDIERAAKKSNKKLKKHMPDPVNLHTFTIEKELTENILNVTHKGADTRIDDILLTALNAALYKMTGINNSCIMMEHHGRQNFSEDIDVSRTMGWFALPYPIKLPQPGINLQETFNNTKETLRMIPNEGIGAKALWLNEKKSPCLPKIYFNFQGEFEYKVNINDIGIDDTNFISPFQFDMEMIGFIYQKQFYFDFVSKLPKSKAALFTNDFISTLEELVRL
jgi:hypothetical protein